MVLSVPQSLDTILTTYISESLAKRAQSTANVSQIAQIITNLEHFEISCAELERSLTNIRSVSSSVLRSQGSTSLTFCANAGHLNAEAQSA